MKVLTAYACGLFLIGVGFSATTSAEPGSDLPCGGRCRGGGGGGPYERLYDPKTVETVSGKILSLERIAGPNGRGGVHASLKMEKGETISVRLGPAWYLDQQDLKLKPTDEITVRGSRITIDGKPAIIALEVTKDGQTLRLRDDSGFPLWARGRRRAP